MIKITIKNILKFLPYIEIFQGKNKKSFSGTSKKHYSPKKKIFLKHLLQELLTGIIQCKIIGSQSFMSLERNLIGTSLWISIGIGL